MTPLEALITVALGEGEMANMIQDLIGKPELALLVATELVKNTSVVISPAKAAQILGMTPKGASKKIENTAVKSDSFPSSSL
jgi:hypothetical protein